jgi:DNA-binding MarR family transcriptional regulator
LGLIIRTVARDDKRAKLLKLTPAGTSVVEEAFSRHAAELESAMAVLNQELHSLLKKLGLFAAGTHLNT